MSVPSNLLTPKHRRTTAMQLPVTVRSESPLDTFNAGMNLASMLQPGDTVALYGDLGAGKTEFVQGVAHFFDVAELVTSPTFTIINQYNGFDRTLGPVVLYHVDLYRIESKAELGQLGFDECTHDPDAIKLIEWAENANGVLPISRYSVIFRFCDDGDDLRDIEIVANNDK